MTKKKNKKTKTKVGIKKPTDSVEVKVEKKVPLAKPPKRIRMLRSCANHYMAYIKGRSYKVPDQVPVETARSWLKGGTAEEDKSLAGVPEETK